MKRAEDRQRQRLGNLYTYRRTTKDDPDNLQAGEAIQKIPGETELSFRRCFELLWNISRAAGLSDAKILSLIEDARGGSDGIRQKVKALSGECGLCSKWKTRGSYIPLAENQSSEFICSKCHQEFGAHLLLGKFASDFLLSEFTTKAIHGLNGNGSGLVDSQGLADALGVTREAVRQWREAGRIPFVRLSDRIILYRIDAVRFALSSEGHGQT